MSGSSLDGLDIAHCKFELEDVSTFGIANWELLQAQTIPYSEDWQKRLAELPHQDARTFAAAHVQYGHYIGGLVQSFIKKQNISPDCIASHGHTIFHHPEERFTTQIGDGTAIAVHNNCKVISDFRAMDVALGGQGAPLAAIADKWLFSDYDFMLNIGGIINITAQLPNKYVAFDITAANQILNALAQQLQLPYDEDGQIAAKGNIISDLLASVNQLPYLQSSYPKSLDNGWVRTNVLPLFLDYKASISDRLRTACEHIAQQTAFSLQQIVQSEQLESSRTYQLLATGGGAFNPFLMDCIEQACQAILPLEIDRSRKDLIEFKEAILMALMAVMRLEHVPNCLASVTGASRDALGGTIHG